MSPFDHFEPDGFEPHPTEAREASDREVVPTEAAHNLHFSASPRCGETSHLQLCSGSGTACGYSFEQAVGDTHGTPNLEVLPSTPHLDHIDGSKQRPFLADLLDELTSGQFTVLRNIHSEDSDCDFESFVEGWAHEAAESALSLADFVDIYLMPPPDESDLIHGQAALHPPAASLGGRMPRQGWIELKSMISQLGNVRHLAFN